MAKPRPDGYTLFKRGASIRSDEDNVEVFFLVTPIQQILCVMRQEKGGNVDHYFITGLEYRDGLGNNHCLDFPFWIRIL